MKTIVKSENNFILGNKELLRELDKAEKDHLAGKNEAIPIEKAYRQSIEKIKKL